MNFSDPSVQAALIEGISTIVSALIAAIAASIIGKKIADRERFKNLLALAIDDIAFLLEVESIHCQRNKEHGGNSLKIVTRDEVKSNGKDFSGKFTPGRANSLRLKL